MFERQGLTTQIQIDQMREDLAKSRCALKSKKRLRQRLSYLTTTFLLVFLLLMFGSIVRIKQSGKIPHIFGLYFFSVQSGSMSPTLEVGDIIVSKKPSSTDDLTIGTIVTYYSTDGQVITHRITDILVDDSDSVVYETKGDYKLNSTDLELLTQDRIIAVYWFTLKHTKTAA